jgi:hypothetical protein
VRSMAEGAGETATGQEAEYRHGGLEDPEDDPDTQPRPCVNAGDPMPMAAAKLDNPREAATSSRASMG